MGAVAVDNTDKLTAVSGVMISITVPAYGGHPKREERGEDPMPEYNIGRDVMFHDCCSWFLYEVDVVGV